MDQLHAHVLEGATAQVRGAGPGRLRSSACGSPAGEVLLLGVLQFLISPKTHHLGLCLSLWDFVSGEASQKVLEPLSFFPTQSPGVLLPLLLPTGCQEPAAPPCWHTLSPYRGPASPIYSTPHSTGVSAGLPNLPRVRPVLGGLSHYLHLLPTLPGPQAWSGLAGWEEGLLLFNVHSLQGPTDLLVPGFP